MNHFLLMLVVINHVGPSSRFSHQLQDKRRSQRKTKYYPSVGAQRGSCLALLVFKPRGYLNILLFENLHNSLRQAS